MTQEIHHWAARAAEQMKEELTEAQRRLDNGEGLSTTAAELGFTPSELSEVLLLVNIGKNY